MEEVSLLPNRRSSTSKRVRSSNTSREVPRGIRTTKHSVSSNSTPRSARPSLATRIASAPLVPSNRDLNLLGVEEQSNADNHRDSVASIKDDPFFRNYQSPHSVSLARELMSEHLHDEDDLPGNPPPRSNKRPSVDNSVNLPVSIMIARRVT
jgi:hypothetical protein